MLDGFLRGFVSMVFFFFVASAITGIGCMGAFVGCVAVFDNIATNSVAARNASSAPCPLPERSESSESAADSKPSKEETSKATKPARKEKTKKTEEPKEDVLTPEEEDLYRRILEAEKKQPSKPVQLPEGILPPSGGNAESI